MKTTFKQYDSLQWMIGVLTRRNGRVVSILRGTGNGENMDCISQEMHGKQVAEF